MKIKIDTDELVKKQVISQQTADEIIQYYDPSKVTLSTKFALGILASIFVLAGIAIFAFDYWDNAGIPTKVIFSLLPVVIGSIASYRVVTNYPDQRLLREGASILMCAAIFITMSSQVFLFNIRLSLSYISLLWIMVSYLFVIILRGNLAASALMGLAAIILWNNIDSWSEKFNISALTVVMVLVLALFYQYHVYYKGKDRFLLTISVLLTPFVVTTFLVWLVGNFNYKSEGEYGILIAMIVATYTFIFNGWNSRRQWVEVDAKYLHLAGFILMLIPLFLLPFERNVQVSESIILFLVPLLPIPLLWYFQGRREIGVDVLQISSLAFTILSLIAFSFSWWKEGAVMKPVAITLFIGYLAIHTYWCIRQQYILGFNVVMFFWIIGGLVLVISSDNDTILTKPSVAAIVFAWGLLLFGLNYLIIRKKKNHELQGNK